MDNHAKGFGEVKARDLTAEIDRETDMKMAAGAEGMRLGNIGGVVVPEEAGRNGAQGRELARQAGWRVINGGRHEMAGMEAAEELMRDQAEVEDPEAFVGEETKVQKQKYLEEDQEDLKRELGEGLKFEAKVAAKSQEAVAKAVMPEVEKIVAQKSFRPSALEKVYRWGVNLVLGNVFGRFIGERNNDP